MTLNVRKLRRELGVDREPDVQCDQWLVWWHEPKLANGKRHVTKLLNKVRINDIRTGVTYLLQV